MATHQHQQTIIRERVRATKPSRASLAIVGRAARRLHTYYRRWFCNQNYVFRHDGPFVAQYRADCTFVRVESSSDLHESIRSQIREDGGERRLSMDCRELDEQATLWIALVDGNVASTVFTRRGAQFKRWFLPLRPEDVVVFRLRTYEAYRGRGLAPSLIRFAMHHTVTSPGCAFIDCRTYNMPSIRCIEKSGFKRIAKMRTIQRDWALYE